MRFAEIFLRLACALVAWMLLYAHLLWLAALRVTGCGPDGDELHRLLLGLSILTVSAAGAIHATKPMHEVHSALRWISIPPALISPWVLASIWTVFRTVNLDRTGLCGIAPPPLWQWAWAPAQILLILVVAGSVVCLWRKVESDHLVEPN